MPATASTLPQRIAISCLHWSSGILAVYFILRFILAVPAAIVGGYGMVAFPNIFLALFSFIFLIGIYVTSTLPVAKANSMVRAGFSAVVVAAIFWVLISILLLLMTWPINDINADIFRQAWGESFGTMMWFGAFISLGANLFFIYVLREIKLLTGMSCAQLLVGTVCLSINWLTIWPAWTMYALPLTFLLIAGCCWSLGMGQLAIVIDRGKDVPVSAVDS